MPQVQEIQLNEDIIREITSNKYKEVRAFTELLCRPLETEDYVIQSMPDVSPAKWHLAHSTWFFEAFILKKGIENYKPYKDDFFYLFNSYYVQMGERFPRPARGLLSRPTVEQVYNYRKFIDEQILGFITSSPENVFREYAPLLEVGFNHEQQHQELILTDIKHVLSCNPLYPVYSNVKRPDPGQIISSDWINFNEGIYEMGAQEGAFSYDNERPRHKVFLDKFSIGSRLVTNAEYMEFMEDEGYKRAEFWLSEGFTLAEKEKWDAPLYWIKKNNGWHYFTLSGLEKIKLNEPVCHVSHFEADAYARWKGCRLPTEAEWEAAAPDKINGNFADELLFHPAALKENNKGLHQFYGDVWEWTGSAYLGYPGFKTPPGALGEYNGKFMSGQMVLRGGSCATHSTHIRKTYRNFFPPYSRWQFSGIRLAKDGE